MDIGSPLISDSEWLEYKDTLTNAHATFNQKEIIWLHIPVTINRYSEDIPRVNQISTTLLVLLNYNFKRSWPLNIVSDSGENDQQSIQIMLNKEYLRQNNLLDSFGNFIYDEGRDLFIIDGTKYKPLGDSPAGQMNSDDVFFTIVVQRAQLETGTRR